MDVHARSTYAASLDVLTGELARQRFDTGAVERQPPHMRLTDVEHFARRLPHPSTTTNPNRNTEGSMHAAHLTTAPPYE
jgi:hypothetical protein